MRIRIATRVSQQASAVMAGFNLDLFEALKPPILPLKVLRFDGCETGDEVHLDLGFGNKWLAKIVDHGSSSEGYFFIDEGLTLPFPLKDWKHRHLINITESGSEIVDDINFTTGWYLIDGLVYPFMYALFWLRKSIYKSRFDN